MSMDVYTPQQLPLALDDVLHEVEFHKQASKRPSLGHEKSVVDIFQSITNLPQPTLDHAVVMTPVTILRDNTMLLKLKVSSSEK